MDLEPVDYDPFAAAGAGPSAADAVGQSAPVAAAPSTASRLGSGAMDYMRWNMMGSPGFTPGEIGLGAVNAAGNMGRIMTTPARRPPDGSTQDDSGFIAQGRATDEDWQAFVNDQRDRQDLAPRTAVGMMSGTPFRAAPAGSIGMFAGPKAVGADLNALDLAQQMEAKGMPRHQVWDATGWFQGADNKWRYEIPDHGLLASPGTGAGLNDMRSPITHNALAQAYPALNDIKQSVTEAVPPMNERGTYRVGGYHPGTQSIEITAPDRGMIRETAAHELQHAVQRQEGFETGAPVMSLQPQVERGIAAAGATPSQSLTNSAAFETYRRLAGEVEARNVANRVRMNPDERRAIPPWATEDIPPHEQIVRGVGEPIDYDPFAPGRASGGRLDRKLSHKTVGYIARSRVPGEHCSACSMFRPGPACSLVRDPIMPGGWCRRFDPKE